MLMECSGAVFVIRPDDVVKHQEAGKGPVYMPRGNVLMEFGLVAGRLGRHNIALCQFGEVDLPSDLAGMTVIKVERPTDGSPLATSEPDEELVRKHSHWASHLRATAERVPRTVVFHR